MVLFTMYNIVLYACAFIYSFIYPQKVYYTQLPHGEDYRIFCFEKCINFGVDSTIRSIRLLFYYTFFWWMGAFFLLFGSFMDFFFLFINYGKFMFSLRVYRLRTRCLSTQIEKLLNIFFIGWNKKTIFSRQCNSTSFKPLILGDRHWRSLIVDFHADSWVP